MNRREYLLVCLSEELAEVQQLIGKCLRFTPEHYFEGYGRTNFEELVLEMNDVYAITEMLDDVGLEIGVDDARIEAKKERTDRYMCISYDLGALEND